MPTKQRYTPDQVVYAIQETRGLVTMAARHLGCTPDTVHNYAKRYPKVADALKAARYAMADVAELALYNAIIDQQAWAVCFYLKTQAKDRGYIERQEISGQVDVRLSLADIARQAAISLADLPVLEDDNHHNA
jgi:hypothetical protein